MAKVDNLQEALKYIRSYEEGEHIRTGLAIASAYALVSIAEDIRAMTKPLSDCLKPSVEAGVDRRDPITGLHVIPIVRSDRP